MARDMKRPRTSGGNSKRGGSSLLTGLLVGLVVGVAAAVGVAFYVNRTASPFSGKSASAPEASPPPAQPQTTPPEVLRPTTSKDEVAAPTVASGNASAPQAHRASGTDRFDFYTMLPALNDRTNKE